MRRRDLATIRRAPFRSADDARVVVRAVSRLRVPGSVTLVHLDAEHRVFDVACVDGGETELLAPLVEISCRCMGERLAAMFLVTDRTGETMADRPDDELSWMELVDLAASYDVTMLDWFVVYDTTAFSVAEHAPIGAQW